MFVSNFQNMSVSGQFEAIKIGDVLSCDTCGDVISVGGTLLAANQIKSVGKAKGNVPDVKNGINSVIEPKISKQMTKRGWDEKSINNLINDPKSKKVSTTDTRFDPSTNSRLNDPATAYIDSNGAYVVRNDKTGAIVQVSNKNDPNWVSPF
ncbi:hypothetical protein J7620_09830 [Wohlfahrtiimonas chitiniclastica]|nr:hypothetical protein [Wohlfahrtiimonas chitiniclastica]